MLWYRSPGALQLAPESRPIERIQQGLNRRQLQVPASNRKIVALAHQRHKAQTKRDSRGAGRDTAIRRAGLHLPGGSHMARGKVPVSGNLRGLNLQRPQLAIQQNTAARALLPVDDAHIRAAQVFNAANAFWITRRRNNAFLPNRERK